MKRFVVGVDIGGTFTDVVALDRESGQVQVSKVPSTPRDLSAGVLAALGGVVPSLSDASFFVHGTTVGLNAFLERRGARVALITTVGFRDVYELGRGNRPDMYNLHYHKPRRLVRRRDVFEVHERIRHDGSVTQPLDLDRLDRIMDQIEAGGYDSVAVSLLHAYANPEHELEIERGLRRRFPNLAISVSHEAAREWREYERTSTVVMNAYIAPVIESYLASLEEGLSAQGMTELVHIMQSNGGVMTARAAKRRAVHTIMSGPVGGAIGGAALMRQLDHPNLLCVDMGGTSFDMSLIVGGTPELRTQVELQELPLLVSMVGIHTIGAGGGSIAWLEAGSLRVGPISAGAQPGPACYPRGGIEPTVTDANLFLGRIDPHYFLGGHMVLDPEASRAALRRVAAPLGLSETELAEGICRIVNANMAGGIWEITIGKGIDPRDFYLVAFGGGGPMHAAFIAEELGMSTVVVPHHPGAFSAWGMLHSDIRHDLVNPFYRLMEKTSAADISRGFAELEAEGAGVLTAEQVPAEQMSFIRTADMRYVGQEHVLQIPMPPEINALGLAQMPAAFHEAHHRRHGHSNPKERVEFVNLRLAAMGQLPKPQASRYKRTHERAPVPVATRAVIFGGSPVETPIYLRKELQMRDGFVGPAIIEEEGCTTVVPPGWQGWLDDYTNIFLRRTEREAEERTR